MLRYFWDQILVLKQPYKIYTTHHKMSTDGFTIPVTSPDKSVVNFSRSWVILWSASIFLLEVWKTYKESNWTFQHAKNTKYDPLRLHQDRVSANISRYLYTISLPCKMHSFSSSSWANVELNEFSSQGLT